MSIRLPGRGACSLCTLIALSLGHGHALGQSPKVTIVNMIPKSMSREANQDSEPTLAVNPSKPAEMAGSAFTPSPLGGSRAPIYISTDGGNTWGLRLIVPSQVQTADITVSISEGGRLYAGILRLPHPGPNETRLNILGADGVNATGLMKVLVDRNGVDQPFTESRRVGGKDRLYVGDNDFADIAEGKTATIDSATDTGGGVFSTALLDTRPGSNDDGAMNGPQIRPAIHPSGTVYVAFYGWRKFDEISQVEGTATADVVVVREDFGGAGKFDALKEPASAPGDGKAGIRVVNKIELPWINKVQQDFGQERVGGDLAIVVDPKGTASDKHTVYLAYADQQGAGKTYTLHLCRSNDSGMTWTKDVRVLPNAKNPALAINDAGKVAFLYQQVSAPGADQKWITKLERSTDGFQHHDDMVLAQARADTPVAQFSPYLGDYLHMMAIGKDFYGIFSMSNVPDPANFPTVQPRYQRNADFTKKRLLSLDNLTPVTPSIDPFFFKVQE
jgi:hypothetical protein